MKLKLIAAAVSLAVSGHAVASIQIPDGSGTSELIFSAWDPVSNQSYVMDTGVTFNEITSNLTNSAYSLNFAVNPSVYGPALGASNPSDILWNVSVADWLALDYSNYLNYGMVGTSKTPFLLNYSATESAAAQHDQMSAAQRGAYPGPDTDPANNFSYFGTIANGAYAGSTYLWGTNWGGQPVNNSASIGDDMGFYYQHADFLSGTVSREDAAGRWNFDGTNLTYGAAVSTVPVPAAAWLFGSGLIGLVGVARRRKA
jgi:hypothetical protein